MANKVQIERHIVAKLMRLQETQRLTGAFVQDAVLEHITPGDWNSIAGWLKANNFAAIGRHIKSLVDTEIANEANLEAASILADDALSLDEYARVEGLP